jgi:hypothetical protein
MIEHLQSETKNVLIRSRFRIANPVPKSNPQALAKLIGQPFIIAVLKPKLKANQHETGLLWIE